MKALRIFLFALAVTSALVLAQASPSQAAVPHYQLSVIGVTLPTLGFSCGPEFANDVEPNFATGINNAGAIAGYYTYHCDGSVGSFVRQPNGALSTFVLPRTGFDDGGNAINSRGDIAGFDTITAGVGGSTHPAARIGNVPLDLGNLGFPPPMSGAFTFESSNAYAINDLGSVVGTAGTAELKYHAFLWRESHMRDLGVLAGRTFSAANAISGQRIVGESSLSECTSTRVRPNLCPDGRAVIFEPTGVHALPTLGGNVSSANDVNASGMIVGASTTFGEGDVHAFSYSKGVIKDLGPGVASAVNNSGLIVGSRNLYTEGQVFDLNSLVANPVEGFTITEARDINESGQIVGWGNFDTQTSPIAPGLQLNGPKAFLLTPVRP